MPTQHSPIPFFSHKREYEAQRSVLIKAFEECMHGSSLILGDAVKMLEKRFATSCGVAEGVGVGNGTDAIALALKALEVGEGDEVITVANTAVPTVAAIRMAGATPVFIDIDPKTLLMDTTKIEAALTPKTKAILPVHLFGNPVPMEGILAIAKTKKLHVIEDCAQAYGATLGGKPVGSFGDIGCFSFYPTKNLGGWGDGGMCVTSNAKLASALRSLRTYGFEGDQIAHREDGVNSRLDELQAALLLKKLEYIEEDLERRREIARKYDTALKGTSFTRPEETPKSAHSYHLYVVETPHREKVMRTFEEGGITTLIHYKDPIHLMPAYERFGRGKGSLPVTENAMQHILSIPLFPYLTDEEVERVCESLRSL